MPFEHYIQKGSQRLRMGYTTGSCAALAAKAAALMLLTGLSVDIVEIVTPKEITVETPVLEITRGENSVSCAVRKDAGDDPDITDGALVFATVSRIPEPAIVVDGGTGIGRVTRPGLDQPVGAAAINSIPRQMIISEVQAVCDSVFYEGGVSVIISIPDGERLSQRTFNPKLGIEGGISVLGTTGIVEPMSAQALIDCIGLELRSLSAEGHRGVVLTPGNYGEQFLGAHPYLKSAPTVKISNYVGDALDFAVCHGFYEILLVAHIGKLVKLAGGIMNTHSSEADCRMELITAHAALAGADKDIVTALMNAVSTDSCIDILDRKGLREPVISSLLIKIQEQLTRRAGNGVEIGAVMFSNVYGLLGQTDSAAKLIESIKRRTQ
jgi:cobalt-precorrin-5B (C1)-methyltransferase